MVKSFFLLPEEKRGNGAVICLANSDLPLKENVSVIPIGYI